MPAKLNISEDEKRKRLLEQKRKCYYKHKELYALYSFRAYYVRALEKENLKADKIEDYRNKIREVNEKIKIFKTPIKSLN